MLVCLHLSGMVSLKNLVHSHENEHEVSQIEQLEGIVTKMGADDAMSAAVYVSSIAEGTVVEEG